MKCSLLALVALVSAAGCGRQGDRTDEARAAVPGTLAADTPVFAELSFIPAEAEAVVRVDLAGLVARSPETTRTLDFVLKAQHPRIQAFLQGTGISLGKEIRTLVLFSGKGETYAVAGIGDVDSAKVEAALRRTSAKVEPTGKGVLFTWKKLTPGAAESSELGEDVAVAVDTGLIVVGTPALVRAALLCRTGAAPGIRAGALAPDLAAAASGATAWGVAAPGPGAALQRSVPGLVRARFSSDIAAPGPDVDGLLDLRAEFASAAEAEACRTRLDSLLSTVATLGGKSALGATFSRLRAAAKLKVEGKTLVARSAM
jgi:hypothetical protein